MSISNLVKKECGESNALLNLTSHIAEHSTYKLPLQIAGQNLLKHNENVVAPQSFNMEQLFGELVESEKYKQLNVNSTSAYVNEEELPRVQVSPVPASLTFNWKSLNGEVENDGNEVVNDDNECINLDGNFTNEIVTPYLNISPKYFFELNGDMFINANFNQEPPTQFDLNSSDQSKSLDELFAQWESEFEKHVNESEESNSNDEPIRKHVTFLHAQSWIDEYISTNYPDSTLPDNDELDVNAHRNNYDKTSNNVDNTSNNVENAANNVDNVADNELNSGDGFHYDDLVFQKQRTSRDFWESLQRHWKNVASRGSMDWLVDSDLFQTTNHFGDYIFSQESRSLYVEPNNQSKIMKEGLDRLHVGDVTNAVLCFESIVQSDDSDYLAWHHLGTSQAANENDPQAIRALKRCLEINPFHLDSYISLAVSYTNEMLQQHACKMLLHWLRHNDKYTHLMMTSSNPGNGLLRNSGMVNGESGSTATSAEAAVMAAAAVTTAATTAKTTINEANMAAMDNKAETNLPEAKASDKKSAEREGEMETETSVAEKGTNETVKIKPTSTTAPTMEIPTGNDVGKSKNVAGNNVDVGDEDDEDENLVVWMSKEHEYNTPSSFVNKKFHNQLTKIFLKAIQLNDQKIDPDLQVGLGILFSISKDYDKSVDCFKTALQVRPKDSILWNKLGATLVLSNKNEEAVGAFTQALQLWPGYVRTRHNLGVACLNLKSYKEAMQHFLTALSQQHETSNTLSSPIPSSSSSTSSLAPTSESIWNTVRTTLRQMDRCELLPLCDEKNVDKFNDIFLTDI